MRQNSKTDNHAPKFQKFQNRQPCAYFLCRQRCAKNAFTFALDNKFLGKFNIIDFIIFNIIIFDITYLYELFDSLDDLLSIFFHKSTRHHCMLEEVASLNPTPQCCFECVLLHESSSLQFSLIPNRMVPDICIDEPL